LRLRGLLQRACDSAPALLILEDLHKLFSPPGEVDGSAATALAESAAELFASFAHAPDRPPVVIVATALAADRLHPGLRAPGLFDWELRLGLFDRAARKRALSCISRHLRMECSEPVLHEAAAASEGFVAAELGQLLQGAQLAAAARLVAATHDGALTLTEGAPGFDATWSVDSLRICEADVKAALSHVTTGARTIAHSETTAVWSEVGGLESVKRALFESVVLPRNQPDLFAAAPLRLTSGALLYGLTGCGKTLLAGALAAEARLPMVMVKGPELLNKFIGASEAAVRDVFARAASCQPCILFFDEFDAIAPRRGQDSTGVTDRVVNQLLCELDGVESLSGVFVLAASNRPELIDPALLRPGRLDRKLFCPLPDLSARVAMMTTLLSKVRCEPSLLSTASIRALALRCEGYSGADVQGMLTTAQTLAVHDALHGDAAAQCMSSSTDTPSDLPPSGCSWEPERPWRRKPLHRGWWQALDSSDVDAQATPPSRACIITQAHLEDALRATRPSINAASKREREEAHSRWLGEGVVAHRDDLSTRLRTTHA